jgi:hypothetical protein
VTPLLESGWVGDFPSRKRCGFVDSDYIRGIQCLLDGLQDCRFTQVVIPKTRIEYEILWLRRELANVLCYQRSPIVRPFWLNPDIGHVVFGMYFLMCPVTRCFDLSEPFELGGQREQQRNY